MVESHAASEGHGQGRQRGRRRRRRRSLLRGGRPSLVWGAALAVMVGAVGTVGIGGAGAAGLAGVGPVPGPPAGAGSRIAWQPCEQDASAECGALSVPVNWAEPDGERFDLRLARRTATDPGARVGSMVFGPGGPGDSGVERIVGKGNMARFSDRLRSRFDIVSFDPRGVGLSNPVRCSQQLLDRRPPTVIKDQAAFDATVKYNRELRADCRKNTEHGLFDHVDTLSMVKDLDAIRAALGERTLTFHGSSYGTLLGEQYAEQYPKRVRALVLESVVDHSLGTREFLTTQAATLQDSFDEFAAWCDRSEDCALHGSDVRALWSDLLARAERGDLSVGGTTLAPFDLNVLVMKRLYDPEWRKLAEFLHGLSEDGNGNKGTRAAGGTGPSAAASTGPSKAASRGAEPSLGSNPFEIFCQDWRLPVRDYQDYARELRRVARTAPDMRYPRALMSVSACLGAPQPDNPQHRLKVRNTRPILLTNSIHDPAAGYSWATSVARQLGRHAVLHTYEGWGHGTYSSSPCAQRTVDDYLIQSKVPARGATCPAVEPTG
ncbi:alpha/beta hydrolase [Streptomyces sp. NPDC048518]|uniref:alpha/beta hydrolase n=1 Tax=Streptomyces sp. NPDC048518 TaxID=3155029 RepID=UPI0033D30581